MSCLRAGGTAGNSRTSGEPTLSRSSSTIRSVRSRDLRISQRQCKQNSCRNILLERWYRVTDNSLSLSHSFVHKVTYLRFYTYFYWVSFSTSPTWSTFVHCTSGFIFVCEWRQRESELCVCVWMHVCVFPNFPHFICSCFCWCSLVPLCCFLYDTSFAVSQRVLMCAFLAWW